VAASGASRRPRPSDGGSDEPEGSATTTTRSAGLRRDSHLEAGAGDAGPASPTAPVPRSQAAMPRHSDARPRRTVEWVE
jgi:hypothetical protein